MSDALEQLSLIALLSQAQQALSSGDMAGAERSFRELTTLLPLNAAIWCTFGNVLAHLKQLTEALSCFQKAIDLEPTKALYHEAFAECLLRAGDFSRGFAESEWNRWALPTTKAKRWDGTTSLRGRSIVIGATGGLGDMIMFARFLPILKERGASRVSLQPLNPKLHPLAEVIETVPGLDEVCLHPSEADYSASMWSIPFLFKTKIETIPATLPYLSPAESEVDSVRKALKGICGLKVGISWHGSTPPNQQWNSRSIPSASLSPLMRIPGVTIFNLQGGDPRRDRFPCSKSMRDLSDDPQTLSRTAAIVSEMDLIITIDSMVAHLSGALGKPTWVMLPYFAEWRWMEDRADSPWYPKVMKLFRPARPGDWNGVIRQVKKALVQRASEKAAKRVA